MPFKKGVAANPKGRPKGIPSLPTVILKDAYLLAAQAAGGGGKLGLVNYLTKVAETKPAVFLSGLNRIIPMQVNVKGGGHITIEIVKHFGEEPKVIEHKPNGVNGHKDPASE